MTRFSLGDSDDAVINDVPEEPALPVIRRALAFAEGKDLTVDVEVLSVANVAIEAPVEPSRGHIMVGTLLRLVCVKRERERERGRRGFVRERTALGVLLCAERNGPEDGATHLCLERLHGRVVQLAANCTIPRIGEAARICLFVLCARKYVCVTDSSFFLWREVLTAIHSQGLQRSHLGDQPMVVHAFPEQPELCCIHANRHLCY